MAISSDEMLVDRFGRVVSDLRISVTDRCNFRCVYCMPHEGLEWLEKAKLLSFDEISRLAKVFVGLGVRTIRLTGGEPTLRPHLARLISMLKTADPGVEIAMTTNGFLLEQMAEPLAAAGLDRVNVSVDTLLEHRFEKMTRRDALGKVIKGVQAAGAAGLGPIKINCVVVRGINSDEMIDFAELARQTGWQVRFIEFMPLDADAIWDRSLVVSKQEIIEAINSRYPLEPAGQGAEPAAVWRFADGAPGMVGVIPSVTEPFCSKCNRVRLTADGQLRSCLFALEETDLRAILRGGAGDDAVEEAIRGAVWAKAPGHRISEEDFVRPDRSMSMIGG